jgi:hypothetical protein
MDLRNGCIVGTLHALRRYSLDIPLINSYRLVSGSHERIIMAKAKPIDEKTIDSPTLWLKAAVKTRHNVNFLNVTRAFLVSHGGEKMKAVFAQLDYNKIDSVTAIQAIYDMLFSERGKQQIARGEQQQRNSNWTVTIYSEGTALNEKPVVCSQSFSTEKEATGWACRYLTNQSASSWYCTIEARTEKTSYRIDRTMAMGMLLNPMKHYTATTPQVKVSKSRLSWGVGGQYNKPQYFSHG